MLLGLKKSHQQIGQHNHRQGQHHDPQIGCQTQALPLLTVPQGGGPGSKGNGNAQSGNQQAQKDSDSDKVISGGVSLFPIPAEAGG